MRKYCEMGKLGAYGTDSQSLINQPLQSKVSLKLANSGDPNVTAQKKQMFPTVATGSIPTAPATAPTERVADYYRFGKFAPGPDEVYAVQPRTFTDFEESQVGASIRIFGQRPEDKVPQDLIPAYTKFFLESVSEAHAERSQIVETFGNFYVFMHGERPPMYTFSGKLVNSKNANWVQDLMFTYNTYLRGTRCTELNAKAILTYGGRQIDGLILSMQTGTQASLEGSVDFSMQVVVFERKYLGFSDDFGFATSDGKKLKSNEQFLQMLAQVTGGPTGKGTSVPGVSKAIGQAKAVLSGGPAAGLVQQLR